MLAPLNKLVRRENNNFKLLIDNARFRKRFLQIIYVSHKEKMFTLIYIYLTIVLYSPPANIQYVSELLTPLRNSGSHDKLWIHRNLIYHVKTAMNAKHE